MLCVDLPDTVRDALLAPLVDHHCHGVHRDDLGRARFELLISEGGAPAPPGTTHFDTPYGMAVRRWCAPVLDLEPHAPPAVYLSRRADLGAVEVNRRLLAAAGVVAFLVDTGTQDLGLLSAAEMGRHGGAAADELVRVEQIEQDVAESAALAVDYLDTLGEELSARAARAVGLKTVVATRCGLDFDPARPSRGSVIAAANRRLAAPREPLTDPVLLRHLLWSAVDVARERGLPLQLHTGFPTSTAPVPPHPDPTRFHGALGHPDAARLNGGGAGHTDSGRSSGGGDGYADPARPSGGGGRALSASELLLGGLVTPPEPPGPHRTDPARLSAFIAALQPLSVPVILLGCYPFHRQAAYLAGLHPHVYVDVGLALPHSAAAAARVMEDLLELAPFHKLLFSSGSRGLAESCLLGALYYRRALGAALAARVREGEWSAADAARVAHMIGSGNARRVYRL
ncbi:Amidohydrolase [Nonomuraea coxensis DSM 45129]|uniref:Amidohydrolase n=1 Tax=Nonomuraea coxensis DSM 45129 TaxID=1122611 RepID=A0ABX8U0U3_9ACTN|nr:amidohydrolase family protein [Nonomuraea coxensis]QYC41372.1 Amidohydrolase [Nonomuraea coxensis DSM 45129]